MSAPLVTCRIFGQMGNQLFQIATTLAFAWDHGAIAVFPELHKKEDRIAYNRDRIFHRLNTSMPPRPFINGFNEKNAYSPLRIPFKKDLVLCGYFQSWKHFHHHRDQLLTTFAPSEKILDKLHRKYQDLLELPNTVAVHVRTHNKKLHDIKLHPFMGFDYFQNAMDSFPEDAQFVVFSERMGWCKKNFHEKCIFIEGNDGIEDFFLMSMMKHVIIANSSYSWWAAYLNQNPNKIIVAPQSFVDPVPDPRFPAKQNNLFNNEDVYFPDWKLIPVNFSEPYPFDMPDFPTQSVNNG
ncbi:MAG: hypothetical protein HW387_1007 [Parachlamydiales bacterium]|nr:hypothetical protein [Parachlamydiales bacterium]